MITSIKELAAVRAIMREDLLDVCARKIARLSGAQPQAQIIPLHRGFVVREPDPLPQAPLREFVATVTPRDGEAHERTVWATCSMEVLVAEVERLDGMGIARVRIEVRPLPCR
jgi:hypothetical protein